MLVAAVVVAVTIVVVVNAPASVVYPSDALVVDADEKASIRSNFDPSLSLHPTTNYRFSLVLQHGQTDSERHQPPTDRCVV